jgi:hypothetical protein
MREVHIRETVEQQLWFDTVPNREKRKTAEVTRLLPVGYRSPQLSAQPTPELATDLVAQLAA